MVTKLRKPRFTRLFKAPRKQSFFLFGARGVGKSNLLQATLHRKNCLWIDLLNEDLLEKYLLRPQALKDEIALLASKKRAPAWVVIDEIQKAPKLLNIVHQIIESDVPTSFAMTGSSARRLKQKGVNLLAGRAWQKYLFPLTAQELGEHFALDFNLQWGSLPQIFHFSSEQERTQYLRSYVQTYIKTEIQEEQWVRKVVPFRKFLPIAAQMNGQPLNFSRIARDTGVEYTTIQSYYEILEDTLLGFSLPGFHRSIRKQQLQASKFYFFDIGIKRALERTLELKPVPGTTDYGNSFEHFIICEIHRLNSYFELDYSLSYLRTKDDAEIDLILEKPGKRLKLVEIKSRTQINEQDVGPLQRLARGIPNSTAYVLSNDPVAKKMGPVWALPWQSGIQEVLEL